jgi:hypothetical protein
MTLEPIQHVLIQTNRQLFFAGGQATVAFLKKVLSSRGMSESLISAILHTVNRGWRDANRTAAGTAALERRFS